MPITFEVEVDFEETNFTDALGVHIVEFGLGFDTDDNLIPTMSVMLVPGAEFAGEEFENAFDLQFGIRTRNAASSYKISAPDFSVEIVNKYIKGADRPLVLDCVCRAIRILVNNVDPTEITMRTFYKDLKGKPLKKYDNIVSTLEECGLILKDFFKDDNGHHYWFFSKKD